MAKVNKETILSLIKQIRTSESLRMLLRNTRFIVGISILLGLVLFSYLGPLFYPRDPLSVRNPSLLPPSPEYPLGTDMAGRDVLAALMYGTRTSLYVGFLSAGIATILGVIAAALSVAFSGIVDNVVTAIISFLLSVPSMLLALVVAFYLPVRSYEAIALILGITMWAGFARALRARLLSLREEDFINMSKVAGYSTLRIIFEDMMPSVGAYVIIFFATHIDNGMVGEATLSLLGLQPSGGYSLGLMFSQANSQGGVLRGAWWWFGPPGIIIMLVVISMLLVSTAVDEIFNPRLRRE
ncbi:MAG: ABC transporter permease [Ignisphaera sp.]|uniref:ABC transporter permease n=1 Tax=Ignisphaera aggregans TaxID=334771 RepID=A0A7C4NNY0_9CREN